MSESEYNAILAALNTLQTANDTCHDDIKELLNMGMKGLQLKMDADNNVISKAIVDLTSVIREHNSRLKSVEEIQEKGKKVVDEFKRLKDGLLYCKKRWFLILVGLVLIIVIVSTLVDIGMLSMDGIFELILKKL